MKTIALFVLLFLSQLAFNQGFVTDNKTWHVRDDSWWDINTEIFKLDGDTIINEITYMKLWESWNDSAMVDMYLDGFLREDSGIIYILDNYLTEDKILYNFNLEPGDTATVYSEFCGDRTVVISGVDSIYYFGIPRKRLIMNSWYEEYWIEGIGSPNGLLYSGLYECVSDVYKSLICCHENDTLIFMKEYEYLCYQDDVGIGEEVNESHVIIHPNPVVQGQSFVIQCDKEIVEVEVYYIAGVLVKHLFSDQQKTLSISSEQFMPGFYLIRIKTTEGQVFSRKLIIARG